MAKRYTQVPISYLEPIFTKWEQAYEKGNITNIFFLPYGDLFFRAMQFADWMKEKSGQKVTLINFETELIVNPDIFNEVLSAHKNELMVLIARRNFLRPDSGAMASVLERWYALNGQGVLVLHEGFPSEMSHYVHNPVMLHKQLIHAIYPKDVARQYTIATIDLFDIVVPETVVEQIITYCGGFPWFINDLLRRAEEESLYSNDILQWKVQQIWDSLPERCQGSLIKGVKDPELKAFGFFNGEGDLWPILRDYVNGLARNTLKLTADQITYDGRDLTSSFSPGERRILAHFTTNPGVVKREQLGELFWQQNASSEYSDWSLDAIMSRLRKKIDRLGLPIVVKTRRGQGYECS